MMGAAEFAICASALGALAADRNPALRTPAWREAIGHNLCAAASEQGVDPRAIAAIFLNENGAFVLGLHVPAAVGYDVGLCGANSHYQRQRTNMATAMHPFACGQIVGQVLREATLRWGNDWRAVASYWSPREAERGSAAARAYYARWARNYALVGRYFESAKAEQSAALSDATRTETYTPTEGVTP